MRQTKPPKPTIPPTSSPATPSPKRQKPSPASQKKPGKSSQKKKPQPEPTVDQSADTFVSTKSPKYPVDQASKNPHRARSGVSQKKGENNGWRTTDILLTGLLVLLLGLFVGGVVGINYWSRMLGAKKLHLFHISHIGERSKGCFAYFQFLYGPPPAVSWSLGYEREIQAAALRFHVPANLLKAMIRIGSQFRSMSTDAYGAIGLMQVTPFAAKQLRVKGNLFHPQHNLHAGASYLQQQIHRHRTFAQALVAYYAQMRQLPLLGQDPHSPALLFAQRVLKAYQQFEQDPGQEIRRASTTNQRPPDKRWFSWRKK